MRVLVRLIVIIVVAIAIAIGGLLMLPGDRIARIAAEQLTKQTGRDVSISSDTSISFYPTLGITTGPAVIGSTDWAKGGPLFQTDSLDIGIDVMALLTGTIRISKLEAAGPQVTLERAADGRTNWDLFPASGEAQPISETPPASEQGGSQKFDLSLERALVTGAALRYIDHEAGTDQSFKNVDFDLRWPDIGGAADMKLAITPFSDRIELEVTVANVMGLAGGEDTPLSGTLSASGATLEFEGVASTAPSTAMQINGTIPEAGRLLRALGQDPVSFGLPADFNPAIALNTQLSFDGTRLAMRKTSAEVDSAKVEGDADIVLGDTSPQITAKLRATVGNTGAVMRVFGQAPERFGLSPDFDPSVDTALTLTMNGSDITANLQDLSASLGDATVAGYASVAVSGGVPDISANMKANLPNAGQTMALLGQPLSNFGLSANAAPSLSTDLSATVKGDTITANLANLVAALAGADAKGALDLTVSNGAPSLSGQVAANIPSTSKLMQALGQSAPDIPKGFGQTIAANTALSLQNNTLQLSNMTVTLDQNTLSGGASIGLGGSVPNVNASLSAGDLDFSALAPADSASSGGEPSSAGQGWSKDRIDASALGLVNGSISIKARSVDLGKLKLGASDLKIDIDRSRAVVTINGLNAYDGSVVGQLVANNRNGLSASADLKIRNVSIKPLLTAVAGVDKISGSAAVNVNVLAVGNSMDALMRSLDGSVGLYIPQGTIAGFDLEAMILQGNTNASITPFTNLDGKGTLNAGRLTNTDLQIATNRVEAKGEGYIDIGAQTMDYLFTPKFKDVGNKNRLSVPVRIKGPWSSLTIRPDLEAALAMEAERAQQQLEEEARQAVEREKEAIRQKVEEEKKRLEDQARKALEDAAKRAAEEARRQLQLDQATQNQLEDAARKALENELGKGLKNLLGGN